MTEAQKLKQVHTALKRKFADKNLILGHGSAEARIVLVGEMPGPEEEREKKPMSGQQARLLGQLLRTAGINTRQIYLTNVIKHPVSKEKALSPKEIKVHATFLKEEINAINPQIVITLGNLALNGVGLRQPIENVHGRVFNLGDHELFPTFHPSLALTNPGIKSLLEADFIKLGDWLKQRAS